MTKRIISFVIMAALLIPILAIGGNLYTIAIYLLAMLSLKEFLDIKESKKQLPGFIKFISYILITLIVFGNIGNLEIVFSLDFRIIAALFLTLLLPTVLYHDRKLYSINDAFYLIGGIFFLGVAFNLMILLRHTNLDTVIYLLIITIATDTYAFLCGNLVGRTKLLESISPKKTLEGMIGGTLFAVFLGTMFYHTVIDPALPLYITAFVTLFLSVIGQFGDLAFSAVKRYFGKKDFSNLIPGHGGILDRLDSVIFVVLAFMFFITII